MSSDKRQNRLAAESSPYLQQHAENPVDWYPWSDEAFELARRTNRPILLSIGYSACHWCHVMAHESFEDEQTAEVMNRLFVNIKVDREERPDVDKIYQTALALLTQQPGGWPLTMFLDPADQRPYFGGTYFPKDARFGLPPFVDILVRVAGHFRENRDEVSAQTKRLNDVLAQIEPQAVEGTLTLTEEPLALARRKIGESIDRDFGGIGRAPKFPHVSALTRLLRHWRTTANDAEPDVEALFLASLTLMRMAEGGIFDQLGGGFFRYSVDRYWQIPHFEKMLYDNGTLLALYAQAYIASGDDMYRRIAEQTAAYLLTDLRAENGGFYAARDADSEGHEGRYYVWQRDEVRSLLDERTFAATAAHFGLNDDANFDDAWHLSVRQPVAEFAAALDATEEQLLQRLAKARGVLLKQRTTRVAPARDEKQLTAWNALAARGFAIAGRALGNADFVDAADRTLDFLNETAFRDGRLLASYTGGTAKLDAYLDDHAFLLDALLEQLQARFSTRHLEFAMQIAELLLRHFFDQERGGFYFTADDAETLMHRPKPLDDDAMPSGNGVAALALARLGSLLGEPRYLDAAERTLRYAWPALCEHPQGHESLLDALEEHLLQTEIIVMRGPAVEIAEWQAKLAAVYAPRRLVFAIDAAESELPGALAARKAPATGSAAYRCVGPQCSLPLTSWAALADAVRESESG